MNNIISTISEIAENKAESERLENKKKDLIIKNKWKWFEENQDKIRFVQETFNEMLNCGINLGGFQHDFLSYKKHECIYRLDNQNRIGIQIGWHYMTATFGLDTSDQSIYIDNKGEYLDFKSHCQLLDNLREGIELFPERIEIYLNTLKEKSEKELNKAKENLYNLTK